MTVAPNATAELDAAQVAQDLDELIMEDDESVDGETPLGGKVDINHPLKILQDH